MEGKRREEDRQGTREEIGGGATQKNGGRASGIKREEGRVGRGWDWGEKKKAGTKVERVNLNLMVAVLRALSKK